MPRCCEDAWPIVTAPIIRWPVTEAATRLTDRADAVPDQIWVDAAHYDECGLAAIILMIATTNLFNRVNGTIRDSAGTTWS